MERCDIIGTYFFLNLWIKYDIKLPMKGFIFKNC